MAYGSSSDTSEWTAKFITPKEMKRLRTAMQWSRLQQKPFRANNMAVIQQMVGANYSENGSAQKVPVNYIELAVGIYTYQLAASAPKALVTTPYHKLKATGKLLQLATNQQIDEMNLEETLQEVVTASLLSFGVVKHGLATIDTVEFDGEDIDVTEPFVATVHIDDWVHDMRATDIRKASFMADRYPAPLTSIQQWDGAKSYPDLYKDSDSNDGEREVTRNEDQEDRASTVTQGTKEPDSYIEEAEVWDIWLPAKNAIITIPLDLDLDGPPLKEREHVGPKEGPYLCLTFGDVPGNSMPLAPAASWQDLADLANRIFRKIGRQAERQKTITAYKKGHEQAAKNIKDANDGAMIGVDGNVRDNISEIKYGGVEAPSLAFFGELKNVFSYFAGNLDTMGGLAPMTETVGQDELLAANASKRVQYMQDQTVKFAQKVIQAVAQYEWEDPLMERRLELGPEGSDLTIPVDFSPDDRLGEWLDYNYKIEPYSMQRQTPGSRLKTINMILQNIILPNIQLLQQQGIQVDFEAILKTIANYANIPEISEFVQFSTPLVPGPIGEPPGKPANTTRTVERVSRPGATERGKNNSLTQAMLGGGLNQDQVGAMSRPTG